MPKARRGGSKPEVSRGAPAAKTLARAGSESCTLSEYGHSGPRSAIGGRDRAQRRRKARSEGGGRGCLAFARAGGRERAREVRGGAARVHRRERRASARSDRRRRRRGDATPQPRRARGPLFPRSHGAARVPPPNPGERADDGDAVGEARRARHDRRGGRARDQQPPRGGPSVDRGPEEPPRAALRLGRGSKPPRGAARAASAPRRSRASRRSRRRERTPSKGKRSSTS